MENIKGEFLKDWYRGIPIPELPGVDGWKDIPIRECGEMMVPVGLFTKYDKLLTDTIYFGWTNASPYELDELNGAMLCVFIREGVAEKLDRISRSLPRNIKLIIFDGFRPLEVQKSLYDEYYGQLKTEHADWVEEKLSKETQRYVSLPSIDPARPSPHNTGGAVDVGLVEINGAAIDRISELEKLMDNETDGKWLYAWEIQRLSEIKKAGTLMNFGTKFDYGGEKASLDYFEKLKITRQLMPAEKEALKNRRWLYWLMKSEGFEAYPDEWWHYNDRKSQMGAICAGSDFAVYGQSGINNEGREFEELVKRSMSGLERLKIMTESGDIFMSPQIWNLVLPAALFTVDWDDFQRAEKIKPN